MNKNVKLCSPWVELYYKIDALFGGDPDVKVQYDDQAEPVIKIFVIGEDKAEAIEKIMPKKKTFGNVVAHIIVIPENKVKTDADLFLTAFSGNPALKYVKAVEDEFRHGLNYVVFEKSVVQYWNDDISDINGMRSTLYEDIARDLFETTGVFFCTDLE